MNDGLSFHVRQSTTFVVNVQAEKLEAAQSNLIHISISVNKALQQLDELIKQQHIDDGSKE